MASLDHRLNPLFSIKECSSCGALYTADFCCSKGGLEDKILVPKPPQNCETCGDPVDGLYCRPCAFVRKCLNEGVLGELSHIDPNSTGNAVSDFVIEEIIRLVENLSYDNSSPRPPEELNSTKSFPPSHIPVKDSDPFRK
ncbi:hypothetical protein Tco_1501817 [Tanacetum coccineum]